MPATWPGFAGTVTLEAAFGDTYQTANGSKTWTDISKYVRGFNMVRGRSHLLNRMEAGTMSVLLDNRDRRFEPEFAAGAYYPDVKVGVPVRLRATYNAITYDLWFGFVEEWPQSYPGLGKDAVVSIRCVDGFKWLAQHTIDAYDDAVWASNPKHYWRLNDSSTSTVAEDSGSLAATGTYTNGPTLRQAGPGLGQSYAVNFDGTNDYVDVATTTLDVTTGLTFEAWVNTDVTTPLGSSVALLNADGSDLLASMDHTSALGWSIYTANGTYTSGTFPTLTLSVGTWHHCVITVNKNGKVSGYVDTVKVTSSTTVADLVRVQSVLASATVGAQAPSGGYFNGQLSRVAVYNKALTDEEVLTHYENRFFTRATAETANTRIGDLLTTPVGWPTADRSLDTGDLALTSSEAQGTVLDVTRGIADDEYGAFYQDPAGNMVFKNRSDRPANHATSQATFGPSNLGYSDIVIGYDDQQLINRVNVTGTGGINVTFRDATSETDYGIRFHHESRHLNTVDANAHAALRVYQHKDVRLRVDQLELQPEADAANIYPHALGRDLADRVTVKWTPAGGGAEISFDATIEGISHDATVDDTWRTVWQLAPAEVWDFWKLGTGALGDSAGSDNARLM